MASSHVGDAPQNPNHLFPVQDLKRRGFGGPLSRTTVHVVDGMGSPAAAVEWNDGGHCTWKHSKCDLFFAVVSVANASNI